MNDARLVEVVRGQHEVGTLGEQPLERLLEGRQAEEPVLLLLARQLDLVDRAAVAVEDLVLDLEVGAARAVPALVEALVRVAVVVDALEHLLDAAPCARSSVVRMKKSLETSSGRSARWKRAALRSASSCGATPSACAASATGSPCSSVPVRKNDVLAALAHVAREHVGGDRLVGVAEVRRAVDVRDRAW